MNKTTWVLLLLSFILSCSKEDETDYPVVFIGDVINLTDTCATFTANITDLGSHKIIESGFVWGLHSMNNEGIKIKNEVNREGVYELQTNYKFLPGKTYYVRAYVQTESEVTYSKEISFSISGQINKGNWSPLLVEPGYGDSYDMNILTNFTFNDTTFFALGDGTMCYYSHLNNTRGILLSNPLFTNIRFSVVYNDFPYLFIQGAFYRFDYHSKTLTKLNSNLLIPNQSDYTGFIINDNIYLGNFENTNNFWKFNITSESWEQINSFPGTYFSIFSSFSILNTGYFSGYIDYSGSTKFALWQYIPDKDQWIQKHALIRKNPTYMSSANLADLGYCSNYQYLYEYNPIFDVFETMVSMPHKEYSWVHTHLFTANNKLFTVYFGKTNTSKYIFQLWVYEK